ncbi:hypothetical protein CYLTODRAFT_424575 [Cylindrobasidium torrendii FP15055 ss-10]|uniref:Uncharacterized protein n=1 Tax=Cylindrobasidium torrendii FP15055 ss-10 TaxID=1314674 RepID=A0A0D7B3Q0_9AGAR|nr:hypothetical protein CYLTODRAFT_424575 [Cylindrobasidium torrendii FP15055 ss-10]
MIAYEPIYSTSGRQMAYNESYDQRMARAEYARRESDTRISAWVSGQRQQASLWAGYLQPPQMHPIIVRTDSYVAENPISPSAYTSVPYIHPDDEEPFVFYSTSPKKVAPQTLAPEPYQDAEIIYSTPTPAPAASRRYLAVPSPSQKAHSTRRLRHRRRLSSLDSIPEDRDH